MTSGDDQTRAGEPGRFRILRVGDDDATFRRAGKLGLYHVIHSNVTRDGEVTTRVITNWHFPNGDVERSMWTPGNLPPEVAEALGKELLLQASAARGRRRALDQRMTQLAPRDLADG